MRSSLVTFAALALVGTGCRTARSAAIDAHSGHDAAASAATLNAAQQTRGIPASGATAAERLAKSPRHAEWVAIRVGATDSVMAWVVYPERRDKAPVVIAIHENTGLGKPYEYYIFEGAGHGFLRGQDNNPANAAAAAQAWPKTVALFKAKLGR